MNGGRYRHFCSVTSVKQPALPRAAVTLMAACRGRPRQLGPLFQCRLETATFLDGMQPALPRHYGRPPPTPGCTAWAVTNGLEPAQSTLWRCWTVCTLADTAEWSTTYLAMLLVSAQQAGLCGVSKL